MAQQPNVEITEAEQPRQHLEPGPADGWRANKPGIPEGPGEVPRGGLFGYTGPDHGWAQRVIDEVGLPVDDSNLAAVVLGLTQARAAAFGRAPVPSDVYVALALCGFGDDVPDWVIERRKHWLAAAAHDKRPGETAVAEVDRALLREPVEKVLYTLRRTVRE